MSTTGLLVLAAAALAYILAGFHHGISFHDEAVPVYGAARILVGDLPYRDFWTMYAPGQFFLLAGLFKLFGPSLAVERVTTAVAMFGTSVVAYVIARQLGLSSRMALLPAGLWTIVMGGILATVLSVGVFPALLGGFASSALLLRYLDTRDRGLLIASGVLLGVCALFRQDFGAYFLVAQWATVALVRPPSAARVLGLHSAAIAGPVAVAGAILLLIGIPGSRIIGDVVVFPVTSYSRIRGLPLPPLIPDPRALVGADPGPWLILLRDSLRFYFPVIVLPLVAAVLVADRRRGRLADSAPVLLVAAADLTLLGYAWSRADRAHAVPAWLPALLLLAWLLARAWQLRARRTRAAFLALGAAWILAFIAPPLLAKADRLLRPASEGEVVFDPPRAGGIIAGPEYAALRATVRYVQTVVPPGERIFVGNEYHDSIVLNDMLFYFLADRHSATRYHELAPGVATTEPIQLEIIRDIERRGVRHIVLRRNPGYQPDPHGSPRLDRFIRDHFSVVQTFGHYTVWERRGS
ncbi:MAG TPA: hypothetical protein VIE41_15020 [Methylomirabilota bacterium]|jgi:hypothetical protein